jgi:hypothetical protein
LARELANKDRYRPSCGVPKPRLVLRGEGMVRTIYPRERRQFVPRGERGEQFINSEGGRRVGFGRSEFVGHSCNTLILLKLVLLKFARNP